MTGLVDPGRRDPVVRVGAAPLPTRYGEFRSVGYRDRRGNEHLAVVHGEVAGCVPLTRVHSECLTGDVFASTRCDCGEQLSAALRAIVAAGAGLVVYLTGHEGRGIGLLAKLKAMRLQEEGLDTVDANLALGLPVDARGFAVAAEILADLGIDEVRLLSNNPAKVQSLRANGIRVRERVGLLVGPSPHNLGYLSTKRERLGHHLPHLPSASSTSANDATRLARTPRPLAADASDGRPTTPDVV